MTKGTDQSEPRVGATTASQRAFAAWADECLDEVDWVDDESGPLVLLADDRALGEVSARDLGGEETGGRRNL